MKNINANARRRSARSKTEEGLAAGTFCPVRDDSGPHHLPGRAGPCPHARAQAHLGRNLRPWCRAGASCPGAAAKARGGALYSRPPLPASNWLGPPATHCPPATETRSDHLLPQMWVWVCKGRGGMGGEIEVGRAGEGKMKRVVPLHT